MRDIDQIAIALMALYVLLLFGKVLRRRIKFFDTILLPSSVIAGVVALLIGPQGPFGDGIIPPEIVEAWSAIPGLWINVVFATLLLGSPLPTLRDIWLKAGPQVVFGQTLAWGQYVVGISVTLLILVPLFGISPLAGALIEISFEGGHGTAAGMADSFRELGFPEGADLALGMATVGVVSGILVGTLLVNIARRRAWLQVDNPNVTTADLAGGAAAHAVTEAEPDDLAEPQSLRTFSVTDALSIQLGFVGLSILFGWLILQGLRMLEQATWGGEDGLSLFSAVPLFPMAMLGGIIVQVILGRVGAAHYLNRHLIERIGGTALDIVILSAIATISLTAIGSNLGPFLILSVAALAWNVGMTLWLAPRVIPNAWVVRGVGDFGQSTGVTVTGLMLMRMADPSNRSGALESFGYKQLMFEPIVGGGLFTAASLPLIAQFGPVAVLIGTGALMLGWIIFGLLVFGPVVRAERAAGRQ